MRSDADIKRDAAAELESDPELNPEDIAVAVQDGAVALTGFVRSFRQKRLAETDAKSVDGVVAVANDIEVRLPLIHRRPDPDIARDVVSRLREQLPRGWDGILVVVKDGHVALDGFVERNEQREGAEQAAQGVRGVKGISNLILLKPAIAHENIKAAIEAAFRRGAEIDANRIVVEANGGSLVLRGTVRSWAERQEAERAARSTQGVSQVDNRLMIAP